jgi:hypothetical protein
MTKAKKNTEIEVALASGPDLGGLIQRPTQDVIDAKLATGRMAAAILELGEGDAFEGLVMGSGQVIETEKVEKDAAGDMIAKKQLIQTVRMKHASGVVVDIMQDYTLKKDLLPLVGKIAWIQRQAQKNVGAKRVNQWAIIDTEPDKVASEVIG